MKINYQNKIGILLDLHDTLVKSKSCWIKAFKKIAKDKIEAKVMIDEYKNGGWKREILLRHGYDYEQVKDIYLQYVSPKNDIIRLCKKYESDFKLILVTNATYSRMNEDIKKVDLKFFKKYTRENGIKPNNEYILNILKENNLDSAIMIGNDKVKDVFDNISHKVKSVIIGRFANRYLLDKKIQHIIKEFNS